MRLRCSAAVHRLLASPLMAWSVVASAILTSSTAAAASPWNTGNLGAAVLAGDRLFAVTGYNGVGGTPVVSGVSDNVNGSWQKLLSSTFTVGAVPQELALWSVVSAAGTPGAITLTFAGATGGFGLSVAVGAFRGLSIATDGSEIDLSLMANGSSTTYDSGTTSGTTSAANELKLGFGIDWGGGNALSPGSTYTMLATLTSTDSQAALEYVDSGSSGTTARATVTCSVAQSFGMGVAVIKLASSAFDPSVVPWTVPLAESSQSALIEF